MAIAPHPNSRVPTGSTLASEISQSINTTSTAPLVPLTYSNDQITGAADLTVRQSLFPMFIMTIGAALMGFSSGITAGQSKAFQNALGLSSGEVSGLDIGFFSAFLVTPLLLGRVLTSKVGYRRTLCVSFALKALGHVGFWPSSTYRSFPGFCVSNCINGAGSALGLTAKIPYIANVGPKQHSELRTLIANTIHSLFLLLGEIVSVFVLYTNHRVTAGDGALDPIKWVHTGSFAIFTFLTVLFALVNLPEITDADLEHYYESKAEQTGWTRRPLLRQELFWAGVGSACFYEGATVALKTFFIQFVEEALPAATDRTAASMNMGATAMAITGKALTASLASHVRPRHIIAIGFALSIACLAAGIATGGPPAAGLFLVEGFARAPVGILIMAMSLRGLGAHTKTSSAVLITASGSAAFIAPLCGYLSDRLHVRIAMVVPLAGFVVASAFAVYVNTFKRRDLDAVRRVEKQPQSPDEEKVSLGSMIREGMRTGEEKLRSKFCRRSRAPATDVITLEK